MSFEIVTDSSSTLPLEIIKEYGIHILSLSYFIDDVEYISYEEGKENDVAYFYDKLRNKGNIKTSLVNTEAAIIKIENLLKQGKDVLYIGFSSGLSGTYQSVSIAIDELREKYSAQKIICIDTLSASLGEGILVYHACLKRKQGESMEDIAKWVEEHKLNICHWFSVDDLFYLKRGGRISAVSAIFGSALSIKPVMHVDDEGRLVVVSKARGRKKALDEMFHQLEQTVENPEAQVMGIAHADSLEDAKYLKNKITEKYPVKEVIIEAMEPVIASHTGPGCIALFFMGSKR